MRCIHFLALSCLLWGVISGRAADESLSALKARSVQMAADVMNEENLHQSAEACEKILSEDGDDLGTLVLFSRVCWSLGNLEADKEKQREWFARGRDLGTHLIEVYPEKPDGYYWRAVNYGEWVDRSSIFVKIGAKKKILQDMDKVLEMDPKYDGGGSYIVVGRINYIAPGGSYSRAIDYFDKAIAINPGRTTAYLYLGELYLHEHMFEKSAKCLKKVMEMEADRRYAIEARDDKKRAVKLMKKLERKDDEFPEQDTLTSH